MRVLLDTSYAARGPSGTGTYLRALARELPGAGVEVVTTTDAERPAPGGGRARSAANLARDAAWSAGELPRRAVRARAQVLHHPLPCVLGRTALAQVVTVHDLAVEELPDAFPRGFRTWARAVHPRAARAADAVVVPSQATAEALAERYGVAGEHVVVAPHGPGTAPAPVEAPAAPAHLLYVGDDEPRKGLPGLLAAHADAPGALPLVLAGTFRHGIPEGAVEGSSPEGTPPGTARPRVRVVERPGDAALRDLLAQAAALVLPSRHEGFGLTVAEALHAGVPVVARDTPAVREVAGGAALLARDGGLAGALDAVSTDAALRAKLRAAGLERARAFSWARSAEAHATAYALALGRAARRR